MARTRQQNHRAPGLVKDKVRYCEQCGKRPIANPLSGDCKECERERAAIGDYDDNLDASSFLPNHD